ncbi:MAG: hypothetical protein IPG53_17695 [Ignavibacteriales bacterium]|nr:hypothetical protein [Ignavibacteriales bacterium]
MVEQCLFHDSSFTYYFWLKYNECGDVEVSLRYAARKPVCGSEHWHAYSRAIALFNQSIFT